MINDDYIDEVEITEEIPSPNTIHVSIPTKYRGERLDKSLAACLPQYSRSKLKTWIEANLVLYSDGRTANIKDAIHGEQLLIVNIPEDPQNKAFEPEDIPLDVIYSDPHIAVINKPSGMVVHPAAGNWSGTLLNALLFHFPSCSLVPRSGIVHRLDKDTSGLLVIAKTLIAQTHLVRQLQARTVNRRYLALVWGKPVASKTIHLPIGRDPKDRLKMSVNSSPSAKEAITHFEVLQTVDYENKQISLLECKLQTGRTHQIRVHLQQLGHPLVFDPVYQLRTPLQLERQLLASLEPTQAELIKGQMLHATQLGLLHPESDQVMIWSCQPSSSSLSVFHQLGIKDSAWQHLIL